MRHGALVAATISGLLGLGLGPAVAAADEPGVTLAAAGDIACRPTFSFGATTCHQAGTAALIRQLAPTAVAALGDNQYEQGALSDYMASFHPTWGAFKSLIRPVPGNHEYYMPGAAGYYSYFGGAAGDPTQGYYSYDLGSWHVLALNSNCGFVACDIGSAQEQWVRADLAAHPNVCTLAYWHHPVFGSGGGSGRMSQIWQTLSESKVDVVLTGHNHNYERFAAQDGRGRPDVVRGIRQFVVGTGGADLTPQLGVAPNSEVRDSSSFGVLLLRLEPGAYEWRFHSENTGFGDAGRDVCHDKTPPRMRSLSLGTRAFRALGRGRSLSGGGAGALLRYRLSEPASVAFAVERARPGRRRGPECAPSRRPQPVRLRCTRWIALPGGFARQSPAGRSRTRFTGRVGGRRLPPGRYRLSAVATDAAQNVSSTSRTGFRIAR